MSSFLDILLLGKARDVLVLTIFGKIWQFREIICPRVNMEGDYLNASVVSLFLCYKMGFAFAVSYFFIENLQLLYPISI